MQSDHKEIYKLTAKRTGESEQLYKDLGNYIFSALYSHLRFPQSIITKLKGVGSWYLRKQRLELAVANNISVIKVEDRDKIVPIFRERLKEYEEYIQLRDKIRKKRHETQTILGSKEEGTSSSPNNSK